MPPTTTLYVDCRVPIFLIGKVADDTMRVEFGRMRTVAGWIVRTEDGRWLGTYDRASDVGPCENRREVARLLVLDFLGGQRPPGA